MTVPKRQVVGLGRGYHGFRRPVYSEVNGNLMYVRKSQIATAIWDLVERTVLRPRARDILSSRFPIKPIWDSLALAQIMVRPDFNLRQKANCVKFYFDNGGINNLYATMGRTGAAWSMLTIDIALDLAAGGSGEYRFANDYWYPSGGMRHVKFDWRTPAGTIQSAMMNQVHDPRYYHVQRPYFRTRCANPGRMNVVILVRSILESLESSYFKQTGSALWPEIQQEDANSFPWDVYLEDAIEFYNSWGEFARVHPNAMVLRYHEIKRDPLDCHKAITDLWGLNIPRDCLAEALRRTSRTSMKEKVPQDQLEDNLRVSFRKERGVLPDDIRTHILRRLQCHLIHNFGYDYSDDHTYGTHYD